jgi:predicted RNA-binding Zn ribbon-like protein
MARRKEPWGDAVGDVPWAAVLPPAPGDLRIVQAFVNTADLPTRTDELASLTGLQDWLKRWGLAPAGGVTVADHRCAVDVRDGLRSFLRANVGLRVDADAVARLDRAAAAATLRVRFHGAATRLEPAADGVNGALGRLVRIVAETRQDGSWKRLKLCANEVCGRSFYDFSRIANGRWCVLRCGNLINSRIYRRRYPGHHWT